MPQAPVIHTFVIGVDRGYSMNHDKVESLLKDHIIRSHSGSKRSITIETRLDQPHLMKRLSSLKGFFVERPAVLELL